MEPAQSSSSANQLNYSAPEVSWEDRLSDLARVEGILKKRKAELQEVDAVLMERRRQLEDVVHKVLYFLKKSMWQVIERLKNTAKKAKDSPLNRGKSMLIFP